MNGTEKFIYLIKILLMIEIQNNASLLLSSKMLVKIFEKLKDLSREPNNLHFIAV
jgi:hypothetical protein